MTRKSSCLVLTLAFLTCLGSGLQAQSERSVMLIVSGPATGWIDSHFRQELERLLETRNGFQLSTPEQSAALQQRLEFRYDKDRLIDEGITGKVRYIIWCDLLKENIENSDGFSFPFVLKQKKATAQLDLEYRIIDSYRSRLVATERIQLHKTGASSVQTVDFTTADPALQLSYVEKKELFDRLETEAASKLMASFQEIARQK